jgi:DNA-binding XRE family transcriptional regulator
MRKIGIPRILKIVSIEGFSIECMFNNGEIRIINFINLFEKWKINKDDPESLLINVEEFLKVELRNNTLSWPNITKELYDENGNKAIYPYEIGPDVLYENSQESFDQKFDIGSILKKGRVEAGLTQEQLAVKSGTTRFYISRIENNKTDIELTTLKKIIEAGLGKQLKLTIE